MVTDDRHILQSLAGRQGDACLAVVAETWGSAPRRVGSVLVIFADGSFEGSVSGGCIEADIIASAMQTMESQDSQILRKEFGISDSQAWEAGLACGGKMTVFIVPIVNSTRRVIIESLAGAVRERQSAMLAIQPEENRLALWQDGNLTAGDAQLATNPDITMTHDSQIINSAEADILLACYPPPPRLVILGAVHIATHLTPMAVACGYEVHIIDPRAAWLNRDTIKNLQATLHESWSDTALETIGVDSQTAFVALTHDPKLDDPAFATLFNSSTQCFYIGALGSKKTHHKRCERLRQAGIADHDIATIKAPIGLNIGAAQPAEIAVAILAEITLALRGAKQ